MAATAPTVPDEVLIRRDWGLFAAITFLFMFGFAIYMGAFQNFFRDNISTDPVLLGGMESLREIPGLLAALMTGLLLALAEARIAALGLVIGGIGIGLTGAMGDYWPLVGITIFWSVGFHLWSTMQPAIILSLAKGKEGGRHLGRMRSVGAAATIAALGIAWTTSRFIPSMPYWAYFAAAGVTIISAGLLTLLLSQHASGGQRAPFVFRRHYGLFYAMTFLDGCRRQIFSVFALFTLIKVYGASLELVLFLSFINAIVTTATSPAMGRLIDRVGEKIPLTIYAVGILAVFIGYATIPHMGWLIALYLIDNVLFTFSVGINTYLNRIVRPGELTPCLAMGTTMNHVAAVSLPIIGALVWKASGEYQLPFVLGAALAFVALVVTRFLPAGPHPKPAHVVA